MTDRTELRRLLGEAPPLPYRDSPRTHGDPSNGPTYVALEAQLEGRWEEVATGDYDRWSGMGIALAAAAVNALLSLLDQLDAVDAERDRVVRLTDEQAEHVRWALRFAKHESEDRELDALLDGAAIFVKADRGEQS